MISVAMVRYNLITKQIEDGMFIHRVHSSVNQLLRSTVSFTIIVKDTPIMQTYFLFDQNQGHIVRSIQRMKMSIVISIHFNKNNQNSKILTSYSH